MYKYIFLNKIKNILLILVVVFLFSINQVNAEKKCPIKDAPSEIIINYKKVLNKKVSDITKSITTTTADNSFLGTQKASYQKTKNDFTRMGKSISAIFNGGWNWGGYHTYWNFYVIKPIYSSMPYQVRRDHDLLKGEGDKLVKFQKFLIKKSHFDQAEKVTELIVINNEVLNCYRKQIVDIEKCTRKTFSTIPDDGNSNLLIGDIDKFLKEFKKIYTPDLLNSCGGDFLKEIGDKFNSISETLKGNGSAFKDWQDAWLMITGKHPDIAKIEKALLIKELSRQGLSSNAINKMVGNLDKMNKCLDGDKSKGIEGKSAFECAKTNNPFTNTAESLKESFNDLKEGFNDAIETQSKIGDKNRAANLKSNGLKDSPIYQTLDLIDKESKKLGTEAEIENLFNFNNALISIPDGSTKSLEGKIINSHINLNSAIKTLDSTIEISRKVCKAQHQGVGTCK